MYKLYEEVDKLVEMEREEAEFLWEREKIVRIQKGLMNLGSIYDEMLVSWENATHGEEFEHMLELVLGASAMACDAIHIAALAREMRPSRGKSAKSLSEYKHDVVKEKLEAAIEKLDKMAEEELANLDGYKLNIKFEQEDDDE